VCGLYRVTAGPSTLFGPGASIASIEVVVSTRAGSRHGDMNSDAELVGSPAEEVAHIAGSAEPKLAAVGEACRKCLGDEQPGPPEAGGEDRCLVKNRAGIEDLEHLRVRVANPVTASRAEASQ
jgi:hypothetical protein